MTWRGLIRTGKLLAFAGALFWCAAAAASAQRLAIRSFQVSDGLAHGSVNRIFQDAKGYIWLATNEGLSRFDNYRFTNYGVGDGLPHIFINDVTADRQGRLWVATNGGGVARLIDDPMERRAARGAASPEQLQANEKKFASYRIADGGEKNKANLVNRILFDAENRLWCVTDAGLYRAKSIEAADRQFERVAPGKTPHSSNGVLSDSRGRLWFGVNAGAIQVADGHTTNHAPAREVNPAGQSSIFDDINSVVETKGGRVLAASAKNIYEFVEPAREGRRGAWRRLPLALASDQFIITVRPARDGGLWIGTAAGLIRYLDGRQELYTTVNGLSANRVNALFIDREDNLWIGTAGGGFNKLTGESVVSYTTAQGLPFPDVYHLLEDRDGRIYAQTGCATQLLVEIRGGKVTRLPGPGMIGGNCHKTQLLQDARGNWWFNIRGGLEFSSGAKLDLRNGHRFTAADGIPDNGYITEMYQDAEGNVWLVDGRKGKLYQAGARGNEAPRFQLAATLPVQVGAEFILRDRSSGLLWLAGRGGIWRLIDGRLSELRAAAGLPAIEPRVLFQDRRGRVWIGLRYHGAAMTANPNDAEPRFTNYTTAHGLASDTVWSIAEDDDGRIYLGTGRGVDVLDVETGQVRHLTPGDGVVGSIINHLLKDRSGNIWAASEGGISKINPRALRQAPAPPPVFISRVRIAGEELSLPETGAEALAPPGLASSRNNIAVEFVALSYQGESGLRYQYKLEGADTNWSAPTEQRTVNLASLAPGTYKFLVRAINSEGAVSPQPAAIAFHILRPVWQRPWFLTLAALATGLAIYAVYRYRVARLLEVANLRTRIATDLHDDIGADLTKIAILSEVANRQLGHGDVSLESPLSSIARISRESVAAMGDIVWAINPQRDHLLDLVRRMRRHAEELFAMSDIELSFVAPGPEQDLRLGVDVRRDLFLIFKEAVNNAARHSGCTQVEIDFRVAGGRLSLRIADDGVGFDSSVESDGQGLLNMRRRAQNLGGTLMVEAGGGRRGTIVSLSIPHARSLRRIA